MVIQIMDTRKLGQNTGAGPFIYCIFIDILTINENSFSRVHLISIFMCMEREREREGVSKFCSFSVFDLISASLLFTSNDHL